MAIFFMMMLAGMAAIISVVFKDVWAEKKKLAKKS